MTTTRTAPDDRGTRARRFADLLTGPRTAWAVALVPVLLAVAVMVGLGEGERTTRSTDSLPDGYDSTAGTALLDRLPQDTTTTAVVLFTADRGELTRDQLGGLRRAASQLGQGVPQPGGSGPGGSGPGGSGPGGSGPGGSGEGGPGLLPSRTGRPRSRSSRSRRARPPRWPTRSATCAPRPTGSPRTASPPR